MKKSNLSDQVAEFILQCRNEELAKLSVTKIADIFDISESFLCRRFRTDKNITVGKYIFRERMFRAASLLIQKGQLTIKSLSETVGFYDYDYFIRTFKKFYGVPPSRYRDCKR
jgi:two-component system response regulator YesN